MPHPPKTDIPEAAPLLAPRVAPRRKSADLRLSIMEGLTAGLSVPHIAKATNRTTRRVRQIIADMLARREFDPAGGFAQIQIARLNDAMAVAHSMMMEGNLAALDRVVKVASELDRYHGYAAKPAPAPAPAPALAPREPTLRLAAPGAGGDALAMERLGGEREILPTARD